MDAPNITSKRILAVALELKDEKLTHVIMSNIDVSERMLATGALLLLQELVVEGFFTDEQVAAVGDMVDHFAEGI